MQYSFIPKVSNCSVGYAVEPGRSYLLLHKHDLFYWCFFFPYFIQGSVALIAFWHTKGGSAGNFYRHHQTDTDEHAQFTSRSWQHHTLIPLLWGWCRDTQAAEPLPLEANHSAPPKRVRHRVSGMCPASTPSKLGSWFKFIIHIVLATDSPGGSSFRASMGKTGCSLLPYGLVP